MAIKLIALIVPLGLDTFAVSAALGIGGVSGRQRTRASLLFTAFEGTMTLLGVAIGRELEKALGSAAEYVAIGVLFTVAIHALAAEGDDAQARSLLGRGVLATVALGLAISLDELAIGLTLGLLRIPLVAVIALIALQTFVAAQLGMRVGARIGRRVRESAEQLAGVVLALLAVGLLVAELAA